MAAYSNPLYGNPGIGAGFDRIAQAFFPQKTQAGTLHPSAVRLNDARAANVLGDTANDAAAAAAAGSIRSIVERAFSQIPNSAPQGAEPGDGSYVPGAPIRSRDEQVRGVIPELTGALTQSGDAAQIGNVILAIMANAGGSTDDAALRARVGAGGRVDKGDAFSVGGQDRIRGEDEAAATGLNDATIAGAAARTDAIIAGAAARNQDSIAGRLEAAAAAAKPPNYTSGQTGEITAQLADQFKASVGEFREALSFLPSGVVAEVNNALSAGANIYGSVEGARSVLAKYGYTEIENAGGWFNGKYRFVQDPNGQALSPDLPEPPETRMGPTPPANVSGPPQIQGEADYDALPSGAQYLDPNGVLRTKGGV